MNAPGFSAESSLYRSGHAYRLAAGCGQSPRVIQPAFGPYPTCWQVCAGDPDDNCVHCCQCVRAGGSPQHCCW
jgi:hypothetical protein